MTEPVDVDLAGDFDPATEGEWRELVERVLKGKPFESLVSHTADGIAVGPLYVEGPDEASTGAPGVAPFTRSFSAEQRPEGRWDVRVEVADADPAAANLAVLDGLEHGASSLLLGGGCLASESDLSAALEGVHLEMVSLCLAPGAAHRETSEWVLRLWDGRGISDDVARGSLGADPIGALAREGRLPQGIERALADAAGLAVVAAKRFPGVRTWSLDTTPYAEAGASEAQELAVLLSTAATYLRAMQNASMDADTALGQIEVILGAGSDYFTTIAKIRAARRVLGSVAVACGADPSGISVPFVVRTLSRDLSRRDPWVNLLRATSASFAAALGGADAIITRSFDSQLDQRSALGERMARNTQLLLSEESGVGRVIDPAGGSWYLESLTRQVVEEAWDLFRVLEGAGGMPAVLLDGTLATRISTVAASHMDDVATRRAPLTGVSEFPNLAEEPPQGTVFDQGAVVTVADSGSASTCERLEPVRWAEPYEALRDAVDAHGGDTAPEVFLANLGPVAAHTARASWSANLFAAGGLHASSSERGTGSGFASGEQIAVDFKASGCELACICGSDAGYTEMATDAAEALKAAGAAHVYLAGRPGDDREALTRAGVDEFVHVGIDVIDMLRGAHVLLGIPPSSQRPTGVTR
ncbi:MAG: methylmalonyl-CoA mutase family protein [Microthrixaceae bacterium]